MSLRAAHSRARPDIARIVTPSDPPCQRFRHGSGTSGTTASRNHPVAVGSRRMNVLALYDIHGNIDALEAVLRAAPDADLVLVGGDAVPGAYAAATLDRLAELPTRWVRGNGEREVAAAVGGPEPAADDWAAIT